MYTTYHEIRQDQSARNIDSASAWPFNTPARQTPQVRETPSNFAQIIERLNNNDPMLTELDLHEYALLPESAIQLAAAIRANTALKKLNLNNAHATNGIGDQGAEALASMLRANNALEILEVKHNTISAQGTDALLRSLEINRALRQLNLSDNQINSQTLIAVCRNFTLKELILDHCVSTVCSMFEFPYDLSLKSVSLRGCNIGSEDFIKIARFLKFNKTLIKIDLSENKLLHKDALMIAEAFEANDTLQELQVAQNKFTMEGAAKIISALKNNYAIKQLELIDDETNLTLTPQKRLELKILLERNEKLSTTLEDQLYNPNHYVFSKYYFVFCHSKSPGRLLPLDLVKKKFAPIFFEELASFGYPQINNDTDAFVDAIRKLRQSANTKILIIVFLQKEIERLQKKKKYTKKRDEKIGFFRAVLDKINNIQEEDLGYNSLENIISHIALIAHTPRYFITKIGDFFKEPPAQIDSWLNFRKEFADDLHAKRQISRLDSIKGARLFLRDVDEETKVPYDKQGFKEYGVRQQGLLKKL